MAETQVLNVVDIAPPLFWPKEERTADDVKQIAALQEPKPLANQQPLSDIISEDPKVHVQPKTSLQDDLSQLFAENITAKVYRTAVKHLPLGGISKTKPFENNTPPPSEFLPNSYPEYVPQEGDDAGEYVLRDPEFWTCGFFPGTLHGILERLVRFPKSTNLQSNEHLNIATVRSQVLSLCNLWAEPLHDMANRQDTHDVGFIIMPALQKSWELTGNTKSLDSIILAARSLATRYVPGAKAIRSWDARVQKNIQITCQCQNVILIIDSMCNLDLLYYAASHTSDGGAGLYNIATTHAKTLLKTHLRPEKTTLGPENVYQGQWYSTYHVANVSPSTGAIKQQFTAQGYSDASTWARGQAWGILGYAQTYMWTKDKTFLYAACGLAEYFINRMETSPATVQTSDTTSVHDTSSKHSGHGHSGRYVPLWDFDAPIEDPSNLTRDSSAGSIAANGMLIISQALASLGDDKLAIRFRIAAMQIVRDLLDFALAPEAAEMTGSAEGIDVKDVIPGQTFEALMKYGTVNNNINAMKRYANHGIVYGDYYLVEFGNRLLRMGLE